MASSLSASMARLSVSRAPPARGGALATSMSSKKRGKSVNVNFFCGVWVRARRGGGRHRPCSCSRLGTARTQVEVVPGEREPVEKALLRFRRGAMDRQITQELRRRKTFEDKQDIIKRKEQEVGRKRRAQQQLARRYGSPFDTRPRRRSGDRRGADSKSAEAAFSLTGFDDMHTFSSPRLDIQVNTGSDENAAWDPLLDDPNAVGGW